MKNSKRFDRNEKGNRTASTRSKSPNKLDKHDKSSKHEGHDRINRPNSAARSSKIDWPGRRSNKAAKPNIIERLDGPHKVSDIIYGRNAVQEALSARTRKFHEIFVLPQHYDDVFEASDGVPIRVLQKLDIEKITGTPFHQGIAARVSTYQYANLKDMFQLSCVVLLDNVEDPQNLGSIIRTAHALAQAGIIIPEHRSASVTPAVVKASSGATEHVKIARVMNLRTAAADLKKNGFWLVGLEADAKDEISRTPRFDKVGIVLGGEDTGIRPVMTSELDLVVSIPMKGGFNSLNVSQAASIALYELSARAK